MTLSRHFVGQLVVCGLIFCSRAMAVDVPTTGYPSPVVVPNLKWEFDGAINVYALIVNSGASLLIRSNTGSDVSLKSGTVLSAGSEVRIRTVATSVITGGSTIVPNDPLYAGRRVIIRKNGTNGDVYIKGSQRFSELILETGTFLRVSDPSAPARLDLVVDEDILIPGASGITADAAGMFPGAIDANLGITTATQGGGSHGGWGSPFYNASNPVLSKPYGSFYLPDTPGEAGTANRGGGVIVLKARRLLSSGLISANGGAATGVVAARGGGAGGSIRIHAGQLELAPHPGVDAHNVYSHIQANGGTSSSQADGTGKKWPVNGGGGGRIAIYYDQFPSEVAYGPGFLYGLFVVSTTGFELTTNIIVNGISQQVSCYGNSGTIYYKHTGDVFGALVVNASTLTTNYFQTLNSRRLTPVFLGSWSALPYSQAASPEDAFIGICNPGSRVGANPGWPALNVEWEFQGDQSVFDRDRDLLSCFEEYVTNCDPRKADTNDDGILDGMSVRNGIDPINTDQDGDGLSNADERLRGTNPFNPDSDGDGSNDSLDKDPLNPNRTTLPPTTGDVTPPVITIETPRVTPLN